jgi:hypothetical protein
MRKSSFLVFLILFSSLLSQAVFAQWIGIGAGGDVQGLANLIMGGNVPSQYLQIPNFFYFIIFPFISIVTIIYGILSEIRIFHSQNVKVILAVMMSAISLPSGALLWLVVAFFTLGAWAAVIAFGTLFFVGTILWALGKGHGLVTELGIIDAEMRKWRRDALDIQKKWAEGGYGSGPDAEAKYMKDLDKATVQYKQAARRKSVYAESAGPT